MKHMMKSLYLDDVRTPTQLDPHHKQWQVVRNYDEFVAAIMLNGLDSYNVISLDHDLGEASIKEYFNNVLPNYRFDYDSVNEKTGLDCAKFLVSYYYDNFKDEAKRTEADKRVEGITFPIVYTHSANPIGSANIMGYINNFLRNERQQQTCVRVKIDHKI